MATIDNVMLTFPDIYNNQDKNAKIYKLMNSLVSETDMLQTQVERIRHMVGIDNADPADLNHRWGSILSLPKRQTETYEQYRQRLKLSVQTLAGGTAESIKFAMAVALDYNTSTLMDRIEVYDAWKYNGEYLDYIISLGYDIGYGSVICIVDLEYEAINENIPNLAKEAIKEVKAAGINVNFIMVNWAIIYYKDMDASEYISLNAYTYNKLGG